MKNSYKIMVVVGISLMISGCQFDGQPIFKDGQQSFNFGGAVNDSAPLSELVRQALRKNPETATLRLQISEVSEDSVKLSGYVDNDAIRHQAERVAGQVEGVRIVVNSLFVY